MCCEENINAECLVVEFIVLWTNNPTRTTVTSHLNPTTGPNMLHLFLFNSLYYFYKVLRFVGPSDNIKSCGFIQMMEQRLENVFAEAQEKVEDFYGTLSVEVVI